MELLAVTEDVSGVDGTVGVRDSFVVLVEEESTDDEVAVVTAELADNVCDGGVDGTAAPVTINTTTT